MYTLVFLLAIVSVVIARTITSPISETQSVVQIKAEIEERLRECKTKQLELETEVASLRQTVSMNILEKQLQAIQNDVIFLIDKSRAEGKKMLSLNDEISGIKSKIEAMELKTNTMDNTQKAMIMNISYIEIKHDLSLEKQDALATELRQKTENVLRQHNTLYNETNSKLEIFKVSLMEDEDMNTKLSIASLERQQQSMSMKTDYLLGNLTEIRGIVQSKAERQEHVGFTAFGSLYGTKPSGSTLLFPDIKSSFGISNLSTFTSTGKFTCEKGGLYFFSVTVMSCSKSDSRYSVYKNNVEIAQYYIGRPATSTSSDCNSGSGTILIQMDVGDNLYVKTVDSNMDVFDRWSSFTVSKLK